MHDKEIVKKMKKSQQEYINDPEYRKKLSEAAIKFHKENPDFAKSQHDKWKKENPEKYNDTKEKQSKSLSKYYQDRPGLAKEIQLRWRKENPKKAKDVDKKTSEHFKKLWREHPEKHPNFKMAQKGFVSKPQMKLYKMMKEIYDNVKLDFPIVTNSSTRYGDVTLTDYNLILEYDGEHWHKDKFKDDQRDLELNFVGWTVIHFNKNNINDALKIVKRLLKNHNDEYEFIDIEIEEVEHYIKDSATLYNLSVADDESYIAKGFVVHNCYCILQPLYITTSPIQSNWQNRDPYLTPYSQNEIDNFRDTFNRI